VLIQKILSIAIVEQMEEIQASMRENQMSKKLLRDSRQLEKQAQKPQLAMYDNEPKPTVPAISGGQAGLKRIVGAGRSKKMKESNEMIHKGGNEMASKEGREFAKHLRKLKGKEFLDAFHKGLMEAASDSDEEMEGGRLVPNAVAPVSTQTPPQAPASFVRNSVSLDREAPTLAGAGKRGKKTGAGEKRAPSARCQLVAQLMKSHKMTLPEASKYLKEHPQ
jgi:hypothetical protein